MNNREIVELFWATMASNDFYAAGMLLHDDYILEWPQSQEQIHGRENFSEINTFYPAAGRWQFRINQMLADGDRIVTDVSVTDGERKDRVVTFSTVRDGKIWRQVEFWPEPFEAPSWRAKWVKKPG